MKPRLIAILQRDGGPSLVLLLLALDLFRPQACGTRRPCRRPRRACPHPSRAPRSASASWVPGVLRAAFRVGVRLRIGIGHRAGAPRPSSCTGPPVLVLLGQRLVLGGVVRHLRLLRVRGGRGQSERGEGDEARIVRIGVASFMIFSPVFVAVRNPGVCSRRSNWRHPAICAGAEGAPPRSVCDVTGLVTQPWALMCVPNRPAPTNRALALADTLIGVRHGPGAAGIQRMLDEGRPSRRRSPRSARRTYPRRSRRDTARERRANSRGTAPNRTAA